MRTTSLSVFAAASVAAVAAAIGFYSMPEPMVEPIHSATPQAIEFTATAMDGKTFDGASLRGKIVLMDFWAVWCAPCVSAVPKLNHLQEELSSLNFEVIGMAVNSGPLADVRSFASQHGMEYRVLVGDDEMPYRYDVIGYPTYLLIDQHGDQVRKYVGSIGDLQERIIADVHELAATTLP